MKTHFLNFISCLWPLGKKHEFLLLHSPWQDFFNFDLPPNVTRLVGGPEYRSPLKRFVWEQMRLPNLVRQNQVDLMFLPSAATCLYPPCKTVISVQNSNIFSRLEINSLNYQVRNRLLLVFTKILAKQASRVVFVSDYSRNSALKVLQVDPQKTAVVHHGTGQHFFEAATLSAKDLHSGVRPYVLTVSTIQAHKNYLRVLDAFAGLCRNKDMDYDYVFAGAIGITGEFERIQKRINQPDLRGRVHYLGEVSNKLLPGLYQGASLFVLPSLLETFGLPLVEAMASGTPIVASSAGAIPEICGDAAVYFDPENTEDMIGAMRQVLGDLALKKRLAANGRKRALNFSWTAAVEKMLELFERA